MAGKRRRRNPNYRSPQAQTAVGDGDRSRPSGETRPSGLLGGLFRPAIPGASPFPPLRESFLRGLLAVCGSPVVSLTIFALVFALRTGLVAAGQPPRAAYSAWLLTVPPISTLFDTQFAVSIFGTTTGTLVSPLLLGVRALITAVLTGMVLESLEHGTVTLRGLIRGLRAWPILLGVGILAFGAFFIGQIVIGLTGLGPLGLILLLAAIFYFFVYAVPMAVDEPTGLAATARAAVRAARIPGSQNLVLAVLYAMLSIVVLPPLIPGGASIQATPGFWTWIGMLAVNVIHMVFLGAYCHRYLVAAPQLPDGSPPPRRR